jgi:3',5'-cyclic AMP phosphodiesterase CpdA
MTDRLRFIHISDTHVGLTADYDSFGHYSQANTQAMIHYLNHELPFTPDFILHTGDVIYNPDASAYPVAKKFLTQLNYPVYYVRGNHDLPSAMCQYLENLPSANALIVPDKIDYTFTIKGFQFVVLDSFGQKTHGYLEPAQLDWLDQLLTSSLAQSVVIATHHLPATTGVAYLDALMQITNHDALFDVLRPHARRIRGVFYGHIHRGTIVHRDGILCCSAPSAWYQLLMWADDEIKFKGDADALPGFNVVTLTHDQTWITTHTIPLSTG